MRNESNKSRHDFDHTVIISKTSKVDKKDKLKLVRKKLRDEELADRKFEITYGNVRILENMDIKIF